MKKVIAMLMITSQLLGTEDPDYTNSLGMKFMPVKDTEVYFCVHETRRKDYEAYDKEVPTIDTAWKKFVIEGRKAGHEPDHPVVAVQFADAVAFCDWLTQREGIKHRLPTDKEWSYAVGNGNSEKWVKSATPESLNFGVRDFPWGTKKMPPTSGNYGDITWVTAYTGNPFVEGYTDGFLTTAPVMSFQPNKFGLYDMGGNVSEWVSDWFNKENVEHTLRGAGWNSAGKFLYSAARLTLAESGTKYYKSFGFRVVVEVPEK